MEYNSFLDDDDEEEEEDYDVDHLVKSMITIDKYNCCYYNQHQTTANTSMTKIDKIDKIDSNDRWNPMYVIFAFYLFSM